MMRMRTTLTIADGLLAELKALAVAEGRPFRKVLEECLRAGLDNRIRRAGEVAVGYTVEPHPSGPAVGVDPLDFNRLADEVDDEGDAEEANRQDAEG
jgi:hypothetical protein